MFLNNYFFSDLELPPHHLIHNAHVGLDDLHDLGAYVLVHVIRYRNAVVTSLVHLDSRIHRLQERLFVDTGDDEITLVDSLRSLGRYTNADGGTDGQPK